MRLILAVIACLPFLSGVLPGAEPDFAKVFPKEKIFGEASFGEGTTGKTLSYTYLTDTEFKELEKQLVKFLGDEWEKDEPVDVLEQDEDLAAMFKKQGMELKGTTSMTRKDGPYKLVIIQLIQMKTKIEGKKAMLTLTVMGGGPVVDEEEKPANKEKSPAQKQPTGGVLKKQGKE